MVTNLHTQIFHFYFVLFYNRDLNKKQLLKLNTIFSVALNVIHKLEGNR